MTTNSGYPSSPQPYSPEPIESSGEAYTEWTREDSTAVRAAVAFRADPRNLIIPPLVRASGVAVSPPLPAWKSLAPVWDRITPIAGAGSTAPDVESSCRKRRVRRPGSGRLAKKAKTLSSPSQTSAQNDTVAQKLPIDRWSKIYGDGQAPDRKFMDELTNEEFIAFQNILYFLWWYDRDYCALATFTLAKHGGWRAAQNRFRKFMRHAPAGIRAYICFLDFHENGSAHLHVLFAFEDDVTTGFLTAAYEGRKQFERAMGRATPRTEQMRRYEGANDALQRYRKAFKEQKRKAGFGWKFELEPIVKPAYGIAVYLTDKLRRFARQRSPRVAGARFVRYSQGCERTIKPGATFSRNRASTRAFWLAVDEVVAAEGFSSRDQMKERFGSRWLFFLRPWFREVMEQRRNPTWLIPRRAVPPQYFARILDCRACQEWVVRTMNGQRRAA